MKLFLGFLFVLLDIRIPVGTAIVGLLPDFIGYYLIMRALERRDDPWRHLAFGLLLGSIVLFGADLVDKSTAAQLGFGAAAFGAEIAMLALLWHLVRKTDRLRMLFPVVACIRVLSAGLGWIPLVGTVCVAAGAVVSVCFLIAAYRPLTGER